MINRWQRRCKSQGISLFLFVDNLKEIFPHGRRINELETLREHSWETIKKGRYFLSLIR